MMGMWVKKHGWLVVAICATTGCTGGNEQPLRQSTGATVESKIPAPPAKIEPKERVTKRPGNIQGKVVVVEYHHVAEGKGTMFRSPSAFRKDLERFYRMGFRPVTVSEYLENRMSLPPGASPMVFTFDDANPSQIQLAEDGTLTKDCALGIWSAFAQEHPDFPIKATFYVLPTMWGQPSQLAKKLELLKRLGCELGNHTVSHPILKRLSDERVKEEIGEAEARLAKLGQEVPTSLALPFGVGPKNRGLLQGFDYKGTRVAPKAVMLVGAEPAPAPTDPKLNRLAVPRVQACEGPGGIDYWLQQIEAGRVRLYVEP